MEGRSEKHDKARTTKLQLAFGIELSNKVVITSYFCVYLSPVSTLFLFIYICMISLFVRSRHCSSMDGTGTIARYEEGVALEFCEKYGV